MLKIKKIKPLFTNVLVTGDRYGDDVRVNGFIMEGQKKGDLKLYQTVVAVGSTVRDIKVGDKVMFDPSRYAVMKYDPNSIKNDMDMNKIVKWNLPWVTMDDENGQPKDYLILQDRDIQYVFEGEEVKETIIVPEKPKLIVN